MARLRINDGYTISDKTDADTECDGVQYKGLEVVSFEYRPALPDAIYEWQNKLMRAVTGKEQLDATAVLVSDHLVSWDVIDATGGKEKTAEIDSSTVRRIPHPILSQLVKKVTTWAVRSQEQDAGN